MRVDHLLSDEVQIVLKNGHDSVFRGTVRIGNIVLGTYLSKLCPGGSVRVEVRSQIVLWIGTGSFTGESEMPF